MKVFLIDLHAKTVTETELADHNRLEDYYRLLHCEAFTTVVVDAKDTTIFVDDEGLLKDLSQQAFFLYEGYPEPLAGYGIVTGVNRRSGDTTAPKIDIEEVRRKVSFLSLEQVRALY